MTEINYIYLYLFSPLHTGGTTQEGNLVGIACEVHTQLPYIPSSTIRGRLRANIEDEDLKVQLFGSELKTDNSNQQNQEVSQNVEAETDNPDSGQVSANQLVQGDIWIGDASLLWFPVASLSHGVVWISCPKLLQRWVRFQKKDDSQKITIPAPYSTNLVSNDKTKPIYLKDAIIKKDLKEWHNWKEFVPQVGEAEEIESVLLLPNNHCATLISMSLWRQVKIKLDDNKSVDGGFRYEEAIPPDTLVYFPWGVTAKAKFSKKDEDLTKLQELAGKHEIPKESQTSAATIIKALFEKQVMSANERILQIGGQESLGRGLVEQFLDSEWKREGK